MPAPKVEWHAYPAAGDPEQTLYDLWIDGKIAEYDVPEGDVDNALRRARIDPSTAPKP